MFDYQRLKNYFKNIYFDYPLSKLTTYRCGGATKVLLLLDSIEDVKLLFKIIDDNNLNFYIIGAGSNILASDKGFDGIILKYVNNDIKIENNSIIASAGVSLIKLSYIAMMNGLSGLEFACSIPGTVGGALYMNAGAYDSCIFDIFENATILNSNNDIEIIEKKDVNYSYRKGLDFSRIIFTTKLNFFIKNIDIIRKKMDNYIEKRRNSQPKGFSAGSVFKNPESVKAYELIDKAGLRGYKIGGACFSEKHANFILNTGNAKSEDIYNLINLAKKIVYEKFGVELKTEIKFLGEFE